MAIKNNILEFIADANTAGVANVLILVYMLIVLRTLLRELQYYKLVFKWNLILQIEWINIDLIASKKLENKIKTKYWLTILSRTSLEW